MHFSFIFLKLSRAGHSKWKTDLVRRVHEIGFWLKHKTERKSSFISVVHVTESPNFCVFVDLKKTRILLTFAEIVNLHNKSFLKDIYDWVLSLVDITWITQILFLSFCAKKDWECAKWKRIADRRHFTAMQYYYMVIWLSIHIHSRKMSNNIIL